MRKNDKENEHEIEKLNDSESQDESNEPTVSDMENDAPEPQDREEVEAKEKTTHEPHENKNNHSDKKQKRSHDKKQEELKSSFGQASQVGGKSSLLKRKMSWVIVAVGGIVLLFVMGGHHRSEVKEQAAAKLQNNEMLKDVIVARIAKDKNLLPATLSQKSAGTKPGLDHAAMNEEGIYTKEMIVRMNAPTSIYESGSSQTVGQASISQGVSGNKSNVKEATFIGSGANQDFGNAAYQTTSVDAKQVPHPESTMVSGEMVHATLNVAMDSDLPGMVTATVTSPAYSYTGENELIPRGSRLIGQYSAAVLQGQSRIFIMWNRVVLPNGISVDINSPDTDQIGQAGEPADYINRHFWSRFGESVLLSILSAGVSTVDVQGGDQYNSAQAYRMAVAESLQASSAGTLQQTISTKPTLVRYQGATINVFIAHDLSFYNVLNQAEST